MKDKNHEQLATKIMMNALEGVKAQIRKAYDKGYEDGKADTPFTDTEEAEKKAYNRGLNDAWEAIKKIALMNTETSENITGYFGLFRIMENLTPMQTIEKIKEYEDKQEQFAVGDEVYSDAFDDKGIITHITDDKVACVCIICSGSSMMKVGTNGLHKTGRHFGQIAEVLAEMRGAENDK